MQVEEIQEQQENTENTEGTENADGAENIENTKNVENAEGAEDTLVPYYRVGDVVEGAVVNIDRSAVYIDLSPIGTGVIYGREFLLAKEILRKIKVGDSISAKIIALETDEGYIDLSLKEARKALIWSEAERSMADGRTYEVTVKNANRGGLIMEWNGIRGFLPASQLSEKHYPKVLNANKDAILNELKKLITKKLSVVIMSIDIKNDDLIFSEHKQKASGADGEEGDDKETKTVYKVSDVKPGVVTGVVDFGVFIRIDDAVEGLVHISEMDWGLVDDPRRFYNVGDQVMVKIIDVQDGKYSLSIKALHTNPWEDAGTRYKVGDAVSGVIIKCGSFGAFASIEAGVTGLIHVSCYDDEEHLRENLEIGKSYQFVILNFDPGMQKLTLTLKDKNDKTTKSAFAESSASVEK